MIIWHQDITEVIMVDIMEVIMADITADGAAIMVDGALEVTTADISEDIIMLPHPHIITIITDLTFGARSDPGVVPMLVVAVAVLLLLSVSFYSL